MDTADSYQKLCNDLIERLELAHDNISNIAKAFTNTEADKYMCKCLNKTQLDLLDAKKRLKALKSVKA